MRRYYISADTSHGMLTCILSARSEREAIADFRNLASGNCDIFDIYAMRADHIPADILNRATAH